MDKFERLAWDSTYSCCILGNGSEFELVDLPKGLSDKRNEELQAKNFGFVGIIGIVQGRARVALALELDPTTISALSHAFVQRIEGAINGVEKVMGDSAEFLQRLYNLSDDRSEMN